MKTGSASVFPCPRWGGPPTAADYAKLEQSWIDTQLADRALLRRVSSEEGAAIVGRKDNGSYSGLIFPYVWPGEDHIREYWLRRDVPDVEYRRGERKEKAKYLGPPGRGNLLYIVPGTPPEFLQEPKLPVAITEGAKKTLALHRLAYHPRPDDALPRFLAIGLAGVWNFRGVTGKESGPNGARCHVKGLLPDFARVAWKGRKVFIVYDSNAHTNTSVAAARRALSLELRELGALVRWVTLPRGNP